MKIKTLDSSSSTFINDLSDYLNLRVKNSTIIEKSVDRILNDIKRSGDQALIKFCKKHDLTSYKKISDSLVSKKEIRKPIRLFPKRHLLILKKQS